MTCASRHVEGWAAPRHGRLCRGRPSERSKTFHAQETLSRPTPEQAGLPAYGGNRRVKGLRREEVAMLAGVSVDYNVQLERGVKSLHHPVVGDLDLRFEAMTLASVPGLTLLIHTAEPGTRSADNLRLLGTWAATQDQRTQTSALGQEPSA